MLKVFSMTLLLVVLGGANVALYAECSKCCGTHVLEDTSHRYCDEETETGWCHISECEAGGGCGECWSIFDQYVDVCSGFNDGEWGMHGCGL